MLEQLGPYLKPLIASSNGSGNSTHQPPQTNALYASERARILFGQYRKGDANDPDTYVAGVAAVLSEYPPETMRWVTDPRTGIAANPLPDPDTGRVWTGMPDLANVKRACEIHYGPTRRQLERDKRERVQIEERKLLEAPRDLPKPTYEQLVERCAKDGLMIGPARHGGLVDPLKAGDEFVASHGLSREQWDAIPNLGPGGKMPAPKMPKRDAA